MTSLSANQFEVPFDLKDVGEVNLTRIDGNEVTHNFTTENVIHIQFISRGNPNDKVIMNQTPLGVIARDTFSEFFVIPDVSTISHKNLDRISVVANYQNGYSNREKIVHILASFTTKAFKALDSIDSEKFAADAMNEAEKLALDDPTYNENLSGLYKKFLGK